MGWRDDYKVHPAADVFPMISDDELAELGKDIETNKLTSQISFFFSERIVGPLSIEYVKANGILADGRNRMEALERIGLELTPCAIEAVSIGETDKQVEFIIGRNIRRRHLTKQEQADATVAAVRAGESFSRQVGEKLEKRAKGRPADSVKAKALALGKEHGISKRTIERALAKAEGKKPSKRSRRTDVEIERDGFIRLMDALDGHSLLEASDPTDSALDLLTKHQRACAIETMEMAIARWRKIIDRLRLNDRDAA